MLQETSSLSEVSQNRLNSDIKSEQWQFLAILLNGICVLCFFKGPQK